MSQLRRALQRLDEHVLEASVVAGVEILAFEPGGDDAAKINADCDHQRAALSRRHFESHAAAASQLVHRIDVAHAIGDRPALEREQSILAILEHREYAHASPPRKSQ